MRHRPAQLLLAWFLPLALLAAGLYLLWPGDADGVGEGPERPADEPEPAPAPRRIVSLAPNLTEIVWALGCGSRLVGRTRYCDHPRAVESVPVVGGYGTPDFERLLARRPDLVLVPEEGAFLEPVVARLEQQGVAVRSYPFLSLEDVEAAIIDLGELLQRQAAARALLERMQGAIAAVAERVEGRPPRRVLVVLDRQRLTCVGAGSFLDELIGRAGGENVFGRAERRYVEPRIPQVLEAQPEVIIDLAMAPEAGDPAASAREFWQPWEALPAVQQGRIVRLDPDLLTRPGPRLIEGLEALARALHPEAYQE